LAAYDVQRVEVLKGPQGTLFGQNSTGGAINFVANKPTDTLEAGFDIGYGRFDRVEGNGYISGPISDTLGARLAFSAVHSDDWQRSASRPGDTNGSEEYYAGRLILQYEPSDSMRFSLNLNAWKDRSDPQAQQYIAVRAKTPFNRDGTPVPNAEKTFLEPFTAENPRAADWSESAEPSGNRRQWQASLRADIDISDSITLTSLTNYVDYSQRQVIDADGLPLILGDLQQVDGDIETFTQELRLANDPSSRLRWLIGANYEDSTTAEYQLYKFDDITSSRIEIAKMNSIAGQLDQKIESIAVFGNLEFDVSDRFTVKASARYTDTSNDSSNCMFATGDGNVAGFFNALGNNPAINTQGLPFTPLVIGGGCTALSFDGIPGDPYVETLSEDNVSWRFGVDYDASDDVLLYATVSRGYKAGSFPSLPAASTWGQLLPVTQESVTAYEAGFKATAWNGRIQLNSAAFYYDYKDKQIRGKLYDPIFRALDSLINVDKSRLYGAEMNFRIEPVRGLTFSSAVTYLNSKVKEEVNYNVLALTDVRDDFAGDKLPYTPEWSYSFSVDARQPVGAGEIYAGATFHGQSTSDSTLGGDRLSIPDGPYNRSLLERPFLIDNFATLDLRAGYDADNWRVGLWAKNVTNEYYYTSVIAGSDTFSRFAGKPATYGITFGFDFQ